MTSDKLRSEVNELIAWSTTPAPKLRAAMQLLEKAHNALDVIEGRVQDLEESKPDAWCTRILDALTDMPTDQIGDYLKMAAQQAAMDHGYTSPEYQSLDMLAAAICSPVEKYK